MRGDSAHSWLSFRHHAVSRQLTLLTRLIETLIDAECEPTHNRGRKLDKAGGGIYSSFHFAVWVPSLLSCPWFFPVSQT